MKKILVLVVVLAISLLGATAALALIAGSQHDLTPAGRNIPGSATDPCMNCHTPHGGDMTGAPLWNRDLAAANIGGGAGLDVKASRTCLSCHDGSLDVPAGGNTNLPGIGGKGQAQTFGAWTPRANGFFDVTTDGLANDHPVGSNADTTGLWGTSGWQAAAPAGLPMYNGSGLTGAQVECATCHDVHAGTGLNSLFLRTGFACANCHNK